MVLGDLDHDGDLDALTAVILAPNKLWKNDGGGDFTDSGQMLVGSDSSADSTSAALGDLDGDGDLDAFFGNRSGANEVWLNDDSGVFSDSLQRLGTSNSNDLALGDADNDGDLDAFVANTTGGGGGASGADRVWLNDGSGNFSDSAQKLGELDGTAVFLTDVGGDGDLDAFTANSLEDPLQSDNGDRVWLNDGRGTFRDSPQRLGEVNSYDITLGDLDSDGDLDAYVSGGDGDRVWLNLPNPPFVILPIVH